MSYPDIRSDDNSLWKTNLKSLNHNHKPLWYNSLCVRNSEVLSERPCFIETHKEMLNLVSL